MARFLGVPLNPSDVRPMNLDLVLLMLKQYSGKSKGKFRTGLSDGWVYEVQQQAQLIATYFSANEQLLILEKLQNEKFSGLRG